jgi:hypothetical protein
LTKRRAAVVVGVAAVILAAAFFAVAMHPDPLQAAYEQVQVGMTQGEVERLVGWSSTLSSSESHGPIAHAVIIEDQIWARNGDVLLVEYTDHLVSDKHLSRASAVEKLVLKAREWLSLFTGPRSPPPTPLPLPRNGIQ